MFEEVEKGRVPEEIITKDFKAHIPGMPPMDAKGFGEFEAGFQAGFHDVDHRLHDIMSDNDRVAVRLTLEAKNKGEFMGIPPSGKDVQVEGSAFFRIENDRVAEFWGFIDMMGLMQQIGGLPAMETQR